MKKLLLLTLGILMGSLAYGQREVDMEQKPAFKDRVFFGGGFGLGGGSNSFYVSASPLVGYMLTNKWSAGVGLNYTYVRYDNINQNDNQYGLLAFTRYNIYRQFFLQAQYDYINYTRYYFVPGSNELFDERDSYSRFLAGGGISQPLGARGAINLVAMYDLSHSSSSPYGSPWVFQVYFSF